MLLDIQAARAVARAKLFERAVNDPGPWSIRIGDQTQWAVKVRLRTGVLFIAHFEPGDHEDVAWLCCGGNEISSMEITPATEGFSLEWKISPIAQEPVRA